MQTPFFEGVLPLTAFRFLHSVHDGARFRAEVAGGRRNAVRLLELDERGAREPAEFGRLVPGRAGAACGHDIAVGVEEDLETLHVVARHADLEIAGEFRADRELRERGEKRLGFLRYRSAERFEERDELFQLGDESEELRSCRGSRRGRRSRCWGWFRRNSRRCGRGCSGGGRGGGGRSATSAATASSPTASSPTASATAEGGRGSDRNGLAHR